MKIQKVCKPLIFTCLSLLSGVLVHAQSQADLDTAIFAVVGKMPEYPGGAKEFEKFAQKHLGLKTEGEHLHLHKKVYVQFIVNKTGQVQNVQLLQGVNEVIDKKVLNIVEQSPNGYQVSKEVYLFT